MQKLTASLALIMVMFFATGCVNRTVSREPSNYGQSSQSKNYGASSGKGKVVEEKRVWIWQKGFRTPK